MASTGRAWNVSLWMQLPIFLSGIMVNDPIAAWILPAGSSRGVEFATELAIALTIIVGLSMAVDRWWARRHREIRLP